MMAKSPYHPQLTAIYATFSTGETFNPCDLQKFDMPVELKKKQTVSAAKDAVKRCQASCFFRSCR